MATYAMLCRNATALAVLLGCMQPTFAQTDYGVGRQATPEEIRLWNIDVRPDGAGLPEGKGTVARGKTVYATYCLACHGPDGQGGLRDRLVGGQGSLATDKPVKTIGSFWPYATTLFDYIHRAMPYTAPGYLSVDDTYAVEAYLLQSQRHRPGRCHARPRVTAAHQDAQPRRFRAGAGVREDQAFEVRQCCGLGRTHRGRSACRLGPCHRSGCRPAGVARRQRCAMGRAPASVAGVSAANSAAAQSMNTRTLVLSCRLGG